MNKFTPIAIKKIQKNKNTEAFMKIIKEVDLMHQVKHPKLVHFYGFWKDEKNKCICLIMDLCNGGDLSSYLHRNNKSDYELNMTQRFEILKDVIEGITQFHSLNIVHRDIKCDNVLISDKINETGSPFKAFLSDYGESIEINQLEKLKNEKNSIDELLWSDYNGTIQYASPEILEGDLRKLSIKSDIYSLGSVIYEIFTEIIPYVETKIDGFLLSLKIMNEKIKPNTSKFIENTPQEIKDLIKKCWNEKPDDRPNIEVIQNMIIQIQKQYKFTNDFS